MWAALAFETFGIVYVLFPESVTAVDGPDADLVVPSRPVPRSFAAV